MEQVVPWAELSALIEPAYPKAGQGVRRWAWKCEAIKRIADRAACSMSLRPSRKMSPASATVIRN